MAVATPQPLPAAEPSERGLPLPSLRIRGYRLFEDLTLPRLARVNLITGKNNTGKTALLEAIRIWADRGSPDTLRDLLARRGDNSLVWRSHREPIPKWADLGIPGLFSGNHSTIDESASLEISANEVVGGSVLIRMSVIRPNTPSPSGSQETPLETLKAGLFLGEEALVLSIESPGQWQWNFPTAYSFANASPDKMLQTHGRILTVMSMVHARGMDANDIERLWDAVSLTSDEDEVTQIVRLLSGCVERLTLRATGDGRGRIPFVRATGATDPIPLARLGDGVNRAFGLGLALVNARNGCLLLDEVENGIHYSVQPELWRMIFATAKRLNVQVFATTHSYDCIRGFQQAATENTEVEGKLIRLLEHEGKIIPTEFDEHDLEVVTRRNLEVR